MIDDRREKAQRRLREAETDAWLEDELETRGLVSRARGEQVLLVEAGEDSFQILVGRPIRWSPRLDRRSADLHAAGGYSDQTALPFGDGHIDFSIEWGDGGMQVTWHPRDCPEADTAVLILRFVGSDGSPLREPVRLPMLAGVWPDPYGDPGFVLNQEWHVEISTEAE